VEAAVGAGGSQNGFVVGGPLNLEIVRRVDKDVGWCILENLRLPKDFMNLFKLYIYIYVCVTKYSKMQKIGFADFKYQKMTSVDVSKT
jgi:hypothetical protein